MRPADFEAINNFSSISYFLYDLSASESDSEPEDPSNKDTTESFLSALKQTCAKKKEAVKPLAATSTVKVTQVWSTLSSILHARKLAKSPKTSVTLI